MKINVLCHNVSIRYVLEISLLIKIFLSFIFLPLVFAILKVTQLVNFVLLLC
jgi:hypothetical protein